MATTQEVTVDSAKWKKCVSKGRALVMAEGTTQFRLGDLALQIVPQGVRKLSAFRNLHTFAEDIGMPIETLEDYRLVAAAWPKKERVEKTCWYVHRLFANCPDRFDLIHNPPVYRRSGQRRWTCDAAHRELGHKPRRPETPEERARAVREYMRDEHVRRRVMEDEQVAETAVREALARPEVAHRVVSDPQTRAHLSRAQAERDREVQDTAAERTPAIKRVEHSIQFLTLAGHCQTFAAGINRTLPELRGHPFSPEERDAMHYNLDLVHAAETFSRSAVDTGNVSMDEQLAKLLRGEEP